MSAKITVVGLGSGDPDQLSLGIWKKLKQAKIIFLRTDKHPVTTWMKTENISYQTFDNVYEANDAFSDVYDVIANQLIQWAHQHAEEIIYAVPGHPMVAEFTVQLLKQRCPDENIQLSILGGESFLEQAFTQFGFDPVDGFQLVDGTQIQSEQLNPKMHTLITQVYDRLTASDVKLALMEVYPDDYLVYVGHALGVSNEEKIEQVPLFELDRNEDYGNLTLMWLPRSEQEQDYNRFFWRLKEIVRILRSPGGCPWDREQTHRSIRKNLIEETYEVLETIDDDDPEAMCEELGDILLQVLLHAQMEAEEGTFTVDDVIEELNNKLIRRHPHVFGDKSANNAEEALGRWQEMKKEEKEKKGMDVNNISVLSGVPRDLPAMMTAWKLQKKAAHVGFDWEHLEDVMKKVEEEWLELEETIRKKNKEEQQNEMGDLLFSIVNVCRFLDVDPELAMSLTNKKFVKRFSYIEEQLRIKGVEFDQTSLIEMDKLWDQAKKL